MTSVTYDPSEIYEVFQDDKENLANNGSFVEVASSDEFTIYLNCIRTQSGIQGVMTVESEGYTIEEDFFNTADECNEIFGRAYLNYIFIYDDGLVVDEDVGIDSPYNIRGELDTFYLDEIEQREGDLDLAVTNFIDDVCETQITLKDEEIEEIKDHFLEYLYRRFGLRIYRPMEIAMPNGTDVYEEYPYPKLQFDDARDLYSKATNALA